MLAAFASSTEAEFRVSYARIPWSVSVFACRYGYAPSGFLGLATPTSVIERLKPGTGEIPLLFSNDPKGSFRCNEP